MLVKPKAFWGKNANLVKKYIYILVQRKIAQNIAHLTILQYTCFQNLHRSKTQAQKCYTDGCETKISELIKKLRALKRRPQVWLSESQVARSFKEGV